MKKTSITAAIAFAMIALTGCGGGGSSAPPTFTTQILSDPVFDGHIVFSAGAYSVTQGNTQVVFAGIDPTASPFTEYRAFLDFPLSGVGGVPGNAVIVSAILDIVINSVLLQTATDTIPIRIDLVTFQPPTLFGTDFDRTLQPALATMTLSPPISQADYGQHVSIDVTSLMAEAQRLVLPDFQVRILEDDSIVGVNPGLIAINDITGNNRGLFAPLLQVTYR